ncbi:flavodoxin family protein [Sporomusa acidovorans]|uniref:NADPH-dependent FMN reductase-like domain-containing protein n=1 Tax=Sporomusa acidovorans (strain ATCC 49682 / DSM 3132 / Mol) TaxID=1123286 RepID=A0ABZ3J2I7_SPOA4|nr:flavodoxin family protein [Sporomusa acidovorans]OZC24158.1 putative NAD(P)H-dependent FMN-containing oxidoreductase YwqN [Sporomusa acidovorans DSM 3132]SDF37571.1 Multimeric flavodoxin WrbA [Sporomusa acidovorans]
MSKNILVLTGSPRKGGNSDKLADAFIAGAQQAGHTVQKYITAGKTIKGCMDCKTCFSKGIACSIPDDFNELAPLVEQADMIVFATPLYFFSFTAHLKAAVDKFFSFYCGQRAVKIKESVLLACAADPNESSFEGLVASYKLIAKHWNWKDCGTILVSGVHGKEDIMKTDGLKRAEELGKNIL